MDSAMLERARHRPRAAIARAQYYETVAEVDRSLRKAGDLFGEIWEHRLEGDDLEAAQRTLGDVRVRCGVLLDLAGNVADVVRHRPLCGVHAGPDTVGLGDCVSGGVYTRAHEMQALRKALNVEQLKVTRMFEE